jgi:hypothetical protein
VNPGLPQKIKDQMKNAGLPSTGTHPFMPKIVKNRNNEDIIDKQAVTKGPKRGKRGFVDDQGRIWIRDRAHTHVPDHWDVQIDGGEDYFRVDQNGNELN